MYTEYGAIGRLTLLCFQKNFAHIFIGYIWRWYQRLVVFDIVYQELSSRWHWENVSFSAFKYQGLDNDGFGRLTLLCFQKNFAHIFIGYIWRWYQRLVVFNIVYLELLSCWYCEKVSFSHFNTRVWIMIVLDVSHSFVFNNTLQTSSLGIYDDVTNVWLILIRFIWSCGGYRWYWEKCKFRLLF